MPLTTVFLNAQILRQHKCETFAVVHQSHKENSTESAVEISSGHVRFMKPSNQIRSLTDRNITGRCVIRTVFNQLITGMTHSILCSFDNSWPFQERVCATAAMATGRRRHFHIRSSDNPITHLCRPQRGCNLYLWASERPFIVALNRKWSSKYHSKENVTVKEVLTAQINSTELKHFQTRGEIDLKSQKISNATEERSGINALTSWLTVRTRLDLSSTGIKMIISVNIVFRNHHRLGLNSMCERLADSDPSVWKIKHYFLPSKRTENDPTWAALRSTHQRLVIIKPSPKQTEFSLASVNCDVLLGSDEPWASLSVWYSCHVASICVCCCIPEVISGLGGIGSSQTM